jgi:ribosomal protein S18 acetylase RimI-like enzyme
MSLEIVAAAAVRRSDQVYFEQTARRETLGCGYAYTQPAFPRLASCNFVGELVLESSAEQVCAEVERYFTAAGLTCLRWIPAAGQPVEPLAAALERRGCLRIEALACALSEETAAGPDSRLRILPARAMRRAYTRVVAARSELHPELSEELIAVQLERLNDPQYDAFVGLTEEQPVGMVTVFQVGQIGRICDLFVLPQARGRGYALALLRYAVATARRWSLRPICAQVEATNTAGRSLLRKAGFQEGGTLVSYCHPQAVEVVA